ncbi:MAG: hypothetical protein ACLQJ0_22140 [Steroidobacteraceae bacterium]|jgi:hypothetical protein
MTINGEAHVLTKFYATRDASLVYTLDTRATSDDLESTASSIQTIAAPIGNRLRRDKLIRQGFRCWRKDTVTRRINQAGQVDRARGGSHCCCKKAR